MSDISLTLLCPASLEEKLLDTLLMNADIQVFTSAPIAAHGLSFGALNAQEQVRGRAAAIRVEVLLPIVAKAAVLDTLREQLFGTGLRYWITPVTEAGIIE